jgi:hypothetical protein
LEDSIRKRILLTMGPPMARLLVASRRGRATLPLWPTLNLRMHPRFHFANQLIAAMIPIRYPILHHVFPGSTHPSAPKS